MEHDEAAVREARVDTVEVVNHRTVRVLPVDEDLGLVDEFERQRCLADVYHMTFFRK